MLHGRGDTAENFRDSWPPIPFKLQLSLPLAPLPSTTAASGSSGHPARTRLARDGVRAAEEKLWPAIVELAHGRR